jgi:opacity protein-like surface antigen
MKNALYAAVISLALTAPAYAQQASGAAGGMGHGHASHGSSGAASSGSAQGGAGGSSGNGGRYVGFAYVSNDNQQPWIGVSEPVHSSEKP